MFIREDNTFNELRGKSVEQWLEEMSHHEDIAVRGGVKATMDHLEELKKQVRVLEEKNLLKDQFLRRLKEKSLRGINGR